MRAGDRVGQLDHLAVGALGVAEHGDVEAGGAEPGDGAGAVVPDRARRSGARASSAGLLPGRRDEAGDLAAVLGAVADRVDRRSLSAQVVVDDDAAAHLEPGPPGQRGRRAAAGSEHDQVGVEREAVVERAGRRR